MSVRTRSFVFAVFCLAPLDLALPSEAEAYSLPAPPLSPQSYEECQALSDAYQPPYDALTDQIHAVWDAHADGRIGLLDADKQSTELLHQRSDVADARNEAVRVCHRQVAEAKKVQAAEEQARRDSERSLSVYSSTVDTGKAADVAAKSYGEAILGGAQSAAADAFLPDAYRQILSVHGMAASVSAMQQSYRTDPFASIGHGADLANELIPRSGTGGALSGVLTSGATSMVVSQSRAIMAQLEHDLDQIVMDTQLKAANAMSFSPVKVAPQGDSLTDQLTVATDRAGQMYGERGAASSAAMQRVAEERAAQRAAEAAAAEAEARRQEDLRRQEEYAAEQQRYYEEQQRYYEEQQRQMELDYQRQRNAALAGQIFSGIISGIAGAQVEPAPSGYGSGNCIPDDVAGDHYGKC